MALYSFENEDGGMSIMETLTEDAAIPQHESCTEIQRSDIPTDRYFRNAWTQDGTGVAVDMPKAREVHMDNIREDRDKRLQETDIEMMIKEEQGNSTTSLKEERQGLRDIPQDFDLTGASTPNELKVLWPDLLT